MLFCTVHFRTRLEAYLDVSHGSKISSGVCLVVVWKLLKICLQWKICSGQTPMKTQNLERNIINHVKWNQRITSFFFPTTKTTSNWITSSKRHHAHKSYIWSSMIIIINFFPLKCSFERDRHTHTCEMLDCGSAGDGCSLMFSCWTVRMLLVSFDPSIIRLQKTVRIVALFCVSPSVSSARWKPAKHTDHQQNQNRKQ